MAFLATTGSALASAACAFVSSSTALFYCAQVISLLPCSYKGDTALTIASCTNSLRTDLYCASSSTLSSNPSSFSTFLRIVFCELSLQHTYARKPSQPDTEPQPRMVRCRTARANGHVLERVLRVDPRDHRERGGAHLLHVNAHGGGGSSSSRVGARRGRVCSVGTRTE